MLTKNEFIDEFMATLTNEGIHRFAILYLTLYLFILVPNLFKI